MRELVEYVAKELVDHPEQVEVTQIRGSQATVFRLKVAPDDKGWVIGKKGTRRQRDARPLACGRQ